MVHNCPECGYKGAPGPLALHSCSPGYTAVHFRVVRSRGSARTYACTDCRQPASDWSYNYAAERELVDSSGCRYSADIKDYDPRCRSCHVQHDHHKDPRLREVAVGIGKALGSSGAGGRAFDAQRKIPGTKAHQQALSRARAGGLASRKGGSSSV